MSSCWRAPSRTWTRASRSSCARSISPSDRNLISTYVDGGFLFTGFSDSYPDDRFGIAGIFGRISDAARALDRDTQIFTGTAYPIRDL